MAAFWKIDYLECVESIMKPSVVCALKGVPTPSPAPLPRPIASSAVQPARMPCMTGRMCGSKAALRLNTRPPDKNLKIALKQLMTYALAVESKSLNNDTERLYLKHSVPAPSSTLGSLLIYIR
jgi:hypothetical protein